MRMRDATVSLKAKFFLIATYLHMSCTYKGFLFLCKHKGLVKYSPLFTYSRFDTFFII